MAIILQAGHSNNNDNNNKIDDDNNNNNNALHQHLSSTGSAPMRFTNSLRYSTSIHIYVHACLRYRIQIDCKASTVFEIVFYDGDGWTRLHK